MDDKLAKQVVRKPKKDSLQKRRVFPFMQHWSIVDMSLAV